MSKLRLTGSTSGFTELTAPAVAGSNTLTLPTGNGSSGQVLSTNGSGALSFVDRMTAAGPSFRAYASSNQRIANGTSTKIALNAEDWDTASCFDSATNYRFTPNIAGYYQINAAITWGGFSGTYVLASIYKNGSEDARGTLIAAIPSGTTVVASSLVNLNGSSDYVELYALQVSGTSNSTAAFSRLAVWMSGFLARPA